MSLCSFLHKLTGHAGKASRLKQGASRHVHTPVNKVLGSKDYSLDVLNKIQDPHGYDQMPSALPLCSAHNQQGDDNGKS